MSHLPMLPVLIPFIAAALLLLLGGRPLAMQRAVALTAVVSGLLAAGLLFVQQANGPVSAYAIGDWPAPYGILFVADRLAATMVLVLFLLAVPALLMATDGIDGRGRHFHALFQLQIAGLAGAFLTGDLFNLFVFFEILLLASYALLLHGGSPRQSRAGLAYVILNLIGSSMFLVAVAFLYGMLGTLNMADLATLLPAVPQDDRALVRAAFAILIGVFLLKAAVLPMAFWLPHVYSAASAPVAGLFALLTKVGVVALLRLQVTVLGEAAVTQGLLLPWLPILALGTIALGTVGLFAARRLGIAAANLVLISSGTLLFTVAFAGPQATSALLYYLPHGVFATGGLLLLAGVVATRRGALEDRLVRGACVGNRMLIGGAFALLAVAVAGLPPLSGFLGKLMLMQAVAPPGWQAAWWTALLLSGLGVTLVLARTAALLFWQPEDPLPDQPAGRGGKAALLLLAAAGPLLVLGAAPVSALARGAADQLHARTPYMDAVLGTAPPTQRERRPALATEAAP
jgi:multicomponent K+:H+ antiporter subunit D